MAFPKFVSFWGSFLTFLWPKVPKNYGIPKIHVFLHPEMLEFYVVGELSCRGLLTGNRMLNFIPFCYWKGAKFVGKIYIFWAILTCIIHALSESESFLCWGQGKKRTCTYFLCKVLRRKDSLPFPREKIDSRVLWHNFSNFYPYRSMGRFFFFFFFFFF